MNHHLEFETAPAEVLSEETGDTIMAGLNRHSEEESALFWATV